MESDVWLIKPAERVSHAKASVSNRCRYKNPMLTRWDQWYSEDNLIRDRRIEAATPSHSAARAAQTFLARRKQRILDLACGIGRDTFALAGCGLSVTGVDASLNGLRVAQQNGLHRDMMLRWVTADARRLPFADACWEGVYCFGLLHEFTGGSKQDDVARVMSEVRRVLCERGILVLTVLAGEAGAGLPAVQLFTRLMFEQAAQSLRAVEIERVTDTGCTGQTDYQVWYGLFEK